MDLVKGKGKKGLIIKTWERCRSFRGGGGGGGGGGENSSVLPCGLVRKSKSLPRMDAAAAATAEAEEKHGRKRRVAPEGCFSVYVGPQKQRFVIKTEYVNHPLFRVLLEEAELEYGYNSEGPLALPCNVDLFVKVLVEMDDCDQIHQGCNFPRSSSSYRLLNPSKLVSMNTF